MFLYKTDLVSVQECSLVKCLRLQAPKYTHLHTLLMCIYAEVNEFEDVGLKNYSYLTDIMEYIHTQICTKLLANVVSLYVNQFFDLQLLINYFLFRCKNYYRLICQMFLPYYWGTSYKHYVVIELGGIALNW